jgi:ABC-2 type transport system permease protein
VNAESNTQSNAVAESRRESQINDSRIIAVSEAQRLYWSVRRELWESRSIYIAPLAVAALFLFGFLISLFRLPHQMRDVITLTPAKQRLIIAQPYGFAALLIMGTTFIVAVFYCLDALYGERRDRSILFWKSLPVSDLTTVLSKASIPLVILPLLTFAITVALQWIMLLLSSAVLLGSGLGAGMLWSHLPLGQTWLMLLYHLLTVHALWYAPIFGWLLLVSAWARRAPFLWAFVPLLAISIAEKIAFNSAHFAHMLGNRVMGGPEGAAFAMGSKSLHPLAHLSPGQFLMSPGLWIGLAVAAAFLAAAVRLRRYQGPI